MSLSLPSFDESQGWGVPSPADAEDDIVTAAIKKEKTIQYVSLIDANIRYFHYSSTEKLHLRRKILKARALVFNRNMR